MPLTQKTMAGLIALSALAGSPVWSQDPSTTYEDEWISLSGTIETVLATSFVLDYGDDDITVELDDLDWDIEKSLLEDMQVTVTGRIDRTLYDERSIEAGVVFVPSLNEYVYADPEDEESDQSFAPGMFARAVEGDWLSFSGRVTDLEDDEITVDTGISTLLVDTSTLPNDLVRPSVDIGDRVLISGEMDAADFFERREVEAKSMTKLTDLSN